MLSVTNLSVKYETPVETVNAVTHASFSVASGETVALVGTSGSGKSTLLSVAAGLTEATDGTVKVDQIELTTASADERAHLRLTTIGVVFQDSGLFEGMTVETNVALPLLLRGDNKGASERALECLALVGMSKLRGRYPGELSGGQRQRVGIARGIVGDRRLLLVDEPTASLDAKTSLDVIDCLAIAASNGAAVLVATHDPIVVQEMDRCIHIRDGCLVDEGQI